MRANTTDLHERSQQNEESKANAWKFTYTLHSGADRVELYNTNWPISSHFTLFSSPPSLLSRRPIEAALALRESLRPLQTLSSSLRCRLWLWIVTNGEVERKSKKRPNGEEQRRLEHMKWKRYSLRNMSKIYNKFQIRTWKWRALRRRGSSAWLKWSALFWRLSMSFVWWRWVRVI